MYSRYRYEAELNIEIHMPPASLPAVWDATYI